MANALDAEEVRDLIVQCQNGVESQRAKARDVLLAMLLPHARIIARGLALRSPGGHQLADDLASEAMLRFSKHLNTIDPERAEKIGAWIRTVIRNMIIDRGRTNNARPHEIALDAVAEAAAPDAAPVSDRRMTLTAAMRELKPEHREILVHVYLLGYNIKDAATELGIPQGTVKSRVHYALRALRAVLESDHSKHDLLALVA